MIRLQILPHLLITHPILHALCGVMSGIAFLHGLLYPLTLATGQLLYYYIYRSPQAIIYFILFFGLAFMRTAWLSNTAVLPTQYDSLYAQVVKIEHHQYKKFPYTIDVVALPEKIHTFRIFAKYARCTIGDTVHLEHVKLKNLGNNSMYYHFKRDGIDATIFYPKLIANQGKTQNTQPLRDSLYNQLKQKIPPSTFALFAPLFLGKTEEKPRPDTKQWGISHFFARSGLHLVVLLLLLEFILSILPIHFFIKKAFFLACIVTYSKLSWVSVSFLRALFMYSLCQLFTFLQRRFDLLHIWFLTSLIILLYNPFHLFCLDFQLSFFLTYILITSHKVIRLTPHINY